MKSKTRLLSIPNVSNLEITQLSCFDLDHTLLKVNSSYQFGVYLYQQGMFSYTLLLYLLCLCGLHKWGLLSVETLQNKIFARLFAGVKRDSMQAHAVAFLDQQLERHLYIPALKRLREAQGAAGHYTAILSSSPDFLVQLIADRLSVDAWDATAYAVDADQCFVRIERFVLGEDKARSMRALSHKWGIAQEATTAYSDSILDLSFLQAAGRAVAVNPDRALRTLCRQTQWPIL